MAAYAYTAVLHEKTEKALLGFPGMKLVSGTINVTNYNGSTPSPIVEIASKFKGKFVVMLENVGTGAQLLNASWDSTNNCVRYTVGTTGAELADNSAGNLVGFIAVGV